MTYLQALVLALVQGVTEFLPISSSAHLILVPYLFGWPDQGLAFDIATNTGTLLAVILYFRRDLAAVTAAGWRTVREWRRPATPDERLAWAVAFGTIPVALAGLAFQDLIATQARNPLLIAATSIGFGLLLGWADRVGDRRRDLEKLGPRDTVVVGLAQALALVPGTSRSGITITAGLVRGLTREAAARFSFLLAVPISLLVAAKQGLDIAQGEVPAADLGPMFVGFAVSAVAAYLVIGWLLAWLRSQSLMPFVVYRVALGLVILAVVFAG